MKPPSITRQTAGIQNRALAERLLRLSRPYSARIIAAVAMSLVISGLNGVMAWLIKPAMDLIFVEHRSEYLAYLPFGVFVLYLLRGGADLVQTYLMSTAAFKMVRDIREAFFGTFLDLPVSTVSRWSTGEVVSRLINDVTILSRVLSDSIKTFLVQIPSLLVLSGVAFYRRWDLALMSFVLLPFIAVVTRFLSRYMRKKRREVQAVLATITHRMQEAMQGIRVIKTFGMEEVKLGQFQRENLTCYRRNARLVRLKEGSLYATEILSGLAIASILGYGSRLVVAGEITSGDFFSILAAIVMAFAPMKKLGSAYSTFIESMGVVERIDELIALEKEPAGGVETRRLSDGITLKALSFRYPGGEEDVLKGLDLFIPAGKITAIVGQSGAGKSTLADLLPRFIEPTAGEILWDGIPLKDMDLRALRGKIAVVSQDVMLFSDTVRENIAAGKPGTASADVERAALMAQAHGFIRELTAGYDTVLSERGLNLSGGQRQRIAIARALLKDPSLLILDEATSALDSISEKAVQEAISRSMEGRTAIVIAHRLSTILHADQIVVMDRGRAVAVGTHGDLIQRDPIYRELYHTWEEREKTRVGS